MKLQIVRLGKETTYIYKLLIKRFNYDHVLGHQIFQVCSQYCTSTIQFYQTKKGLTESNILKEFTKASNCQI